MSFAQNTCRSFISVLSFPPCFSLLEAQPLKTSQGISEGASEIVIENIYIYEG